MSLSKIRNENERFFRLVFTKMLVFMSETWSINVSTDILKSSLYFSSPTLQHVLHILAGLAYKSGYRGEGVGLKNQTIEVWSSQPFLEIR